MSNIVLSLYFKSLAYFGYAEWLYNTKQSLRFSLKLSITRQAPKDLTGITEVLMFSIMIGNDTF